MTVQELKKRIETELKCYKEMCYDEDSQCVQRCALILQLIEEHERNEQK